MKLIKYAILMITISSVAYYANNYQHYKNINISDGHNLFSYIDGPPCSSKHSGQTDHSHNGNQECLQHCGSCNIIVTQKREAFNLNKLDIRKKLLIPIYLNSYQSIYPKGIFRPPIYS